MTSTPVRAITVASPDPGPAAEALVFEVLRSGQLAQGRMVERFEDLCAAMAGSTFAVAMANGTVTLEAIIEALGIGPGDEIITSPLTFAATVNAILRSGATVRFADVACDYTMDPESAAALVTSRTRALLPVHLFGLMADMGAIDRVAGRNGLAVIEDAAQAHGARDGDRRAGGCGTGSFSFYATKNVTAGEGGAVTTSDAGLARHLRLLRNQGMERAYHFEIVGRNLRLTDLHAAVAIPALERLDDLNRIRASHAAQLTSSLTGDSGLVLPIVPPGRTHVWHQYTVVLPPGTDRASVVSLMREEGVHAGVYYPRLAWDHPAYRGHPGVVVDPTPRAADIVVRCVSLPVHSGLDAADIDRVATALLGALRASPQYVH